MATERTLSIIKPDGVAKNIIGEIYRRFDGAGLRIVAARMVHLSKEQAQAFYAVHKERPFYNDLVKFMTSGPVMVQVLEGDNAVAKHRDIMGATNPKTAAPGTIRADFADSVEEKVVHCSDAAETAKQGIEFVFSTGEPLRNFDTVARAMIIMIDDFAYGPSKRRGTLSTAGGVPGIDQLREACHVSLAVALHAPDDALRNQLVPLNKKYNIAEQMAACRRYLDGVPHRKITFEYVMLAGINDTPAHAHALVKVLSDMPAKVNLIPFNPFPNTSYTCSAPEVIKVFRDIVTRAGLVTVTRKTRGDDIDAACGQLVGRVMDRTRRSQRAAAGRPVS